MSVSQIGYGAGTRDTPHTPNVLRIVIGERTSASIAGVERAAEHVLKIECEIDDMNPQLFAPASDRLFQAGALDVFLTPVLMMVFGIASAGGAALFLLIVGLAVAGSRRERLNPPTR